MKPRLILAADSSESSLTLLHQVLVHLGHSVVLAATASEAVEQAARHRPNAILLDLQLSGGDTLTTMRRLATEGWAATTPLIALADAGTAPIQHPRFAAVVRKPIVLGELAAALERCAGADPAPASRLTTGLREVRWMVVDGRSQAATACG